MYLRDFFPEQLEDAPQAYDLMTPDQLDAFRDIGHRLASGMFLLSFSNGVSNEEVEYDIDDDRGSGTLLSGHLHVPVQGELYTFLVPTSAASDQRNRPGRSARFGIIYAPPGSYELTTRGLKPQEDEAATRLSFGAQIDDETGDYDLRAITLTRYNRDDRFLWNNIYDSEDTPTGGQDLIRFFEETAQRVEEIAPTIPPRQG